MSAPAAIDFIHVSHTYGVRPLIDDFTVSIRDSSITAVLGKSGSGKSTLLQIINGMIKPQAGDVLIHGNPINYKKLAALRRQTGYVIQQVGLFPHMTIRENIGLLGRICKRPQAEIRKRTEDLMTMVQLSTNYLDQYPHELSGGEQQRAGLCRALLLHPSVLLMDEPFASLDHATKQNIYRYLLEIQMKEPKAIVLVTHDWDEAMTLADSFIWIENGKIKASGDKQDLIQFRDIYFSEA